MNPNNWSSTFLSWWKIEKEWLSPCWDGMLCPHYNLSIWRARDGAVVRVLASHQYRPGSNLGVNAICGLSLLMVLSLAPRGFSPGTLVFLSLQKLTFPNSNSTKNQVDEEPLCGCATSKSLLLLLLLLLKLTN